MGEPPARPYRVCASAGGGRPDRSPLHGLSVLCGLVRQMADFCYRPVICRRSHATASFMDSLAVPPAPVLRSNFPGGRRACPRARFSPMRAAAYQIGNLDLSFAASRRRASLSRRRSAYAAPAYLGRSPYAVCPGYNRERQRTYDVRYASPCANKGTKKADSI